MISGVSDGKCDHDGNVCVSFFFKNGVHVQSNQQWTDHGRIDGFQLAKEMVVIRHGRWMCLLE